jgi:hypothetical protein
MAVDHQQQPPAKKQRVAEVTIQQADLEQVVPLYTRSRQFGTAGGLLGSAGGGSGHGRQPARAAAAARRPFSSLLLAPAALLEPPAALQAAAGSGLEAGLRWQVLPGADGAAHRSLPQGTGTLPSLQQQQQQQPQPPQADQGGATTAAVPSETSTGSERYFAAAAPAQLAASQAQQQQQQQQQQHANTQAMQDDRPAPPPHPYWKRQYEQLLQQRPGDEQLRLGFALRHVAEAAAAPDGRVLSAGERLAKVNKTKK